MKLFLNIIFLLPLLLAASLLAAEPEPNSPYRHLLEEGIAKVDATNLLTPEVVMQEGKQLKQEVIVLVVRVLPNILHHNYQRKNIHPAQSNGPKPGTDNHIFNYKLFTIKNCAAAQLNSVISIKINNTHRGKEKTTPLVVFGDVNKTGAEEILQKVARSSVLNMASPFKNINVIDTNDWATKGYNSAAQKTVSHAGMGLSVLWGFFEFATVIMQLLSLVVAYVSAMIH